mgnify:FL=1
MGKRNERGRGFNVIEMVVVIAIVALLAAIASEDSPCAEHAFRELAVPDS